MPPEEVAGVVEGLDEAALLWRPPQSHEREALRGIVKNLNFGDWTLRADRRSVFLEMDQGRRELRTWLYANARQAEDDETQFGVMILGRNYQSIPRNGRGQPKFEVHAIRPCSRIGPDGQQRVDLVAEIVQRQPEPTAAARIQQPMAELDLAKAFDQYMPAVAKAITEAGASIGGPPYGRYHRFGPDVVDVEIGFPVAGAPAGMPTLGSGAPGEVGRSELLTCGLSD